MVVAEVGVEEEEVVDLIEGKKSFIKGFKISVNRMEHECHYICDGMPLK